MKPPDSADAPVPNLNAPGDFAGDRHSSSFEKAVVACEDAVPEDGLQRALSFVSIPKRNAGAG